MSDTLPYFLGIDVSTTATKALLIDASGQVAAVAATEYPFETPRPLWSEQHPRLWWDGAQQSIRAALAQAGIDPAQVGGGLPGLPRHQHRGHGHGRTLPQLRQYDGRH